MQSPQYIYWDDLAREVIKVLSLCGSDVIPVLLEVLADPREEFSHLRSRQEAARALGRIGGPTATEGLQTVAVSIRGRRGLGDLREVVRDALAELKRSTSS